VVWTGDFRVFFYNPSTRTSLWERPEELAGRADVDKIVQKQPDGSKGMCIFFSIIYYIYIIVL
jgi:transcription elongation regulator 1